MLQILQFYWLDGCKLKVLGSIQAHKRIHLMNVHQPHAAQGI
jgi:hypothetical protein